LKNAFSGQATSAFLSADDETEEAEEEVDADVDYVLVDWAEDAPDAEDWLVDCEDCCP
jgi:hypothetical protein